MKTKLFKASLLPFFLILFTTSLLSCKKDMIEVNELKNYSQVGHVPAHEYDGGWNLMLQPNGVADVNPGGDIIYRGTYKINGSKIKVTSPQNSETYTFEILSETQIKEKKYGTILELR